MLVIILLSNTFGCEEKKGRQVRKLWKKAALAQKKEHKNGFVLLFPCVQQRLSLQAQVLYQKTGSF